MFQQDALLPWKTVLGNIQFGLTIRGQNGRDALENAQAWVERVGLTGFGNHYPYQLSGGMRKRAAMAQCWIVQPDLILMDEPFSALDVHTRLRMESEILGLWAGSGQTVVFVTHDLEEAIALSDRRVPAVRRTRRSSGRPLCHRSRETQESHRHQDRPAIPPAVPGHLDGPAPGSVEEL